MLGMSAYSVYKGKKPGEKVADDLIVPEVRDHALSSVQSLIILIRYCTKGNVASHCKTWRMGKRRKSFPPRNV